MKEVTVQRPARNDAFQGTALLVLLFSLLLLVGSLLQLMYRFTLPTDGWLMVTTEIGDSNWIYWHNLVGALSDLQQGDLLLAVEDVDLTGQATMSYSQPPPDWQVGQLVPVLVQRGEQQIPLSLPVVNWTLPAVLDSITFDLDSFTSLLGGLAMVVIGFFTFFRRPDLPSARLLLVFCSSVAATVLSSILPDGLSVQFSPLAFRLVAFYSYAIFGTLLIPSLLTFTLYFPQPKNILQRYPLIGAIPYTFGAVLFILLNFSTLPAEAAWLSTLVMVLISLAALLHSGFTQRDAVSQAQFRWAAGSLVVGIILLLNVFPAALGWLTDEFYLEVLSATSGLAFTVIGLGFSIAILRYRLFDIDLIIRRTLLYSTVTIILALLYAGSVVTLQRIFEILVGRPDSPLVIVISTLTIAALFNPLRRRLQAIIDRRFYRRAYDPQKTLDDFSHRISNELQTSKLCEDILNTVQMTFEPTQTKLWLLDSSEKQ